MAKSRLIGNRTNKMMVQAMQQRAFDVRGRTFQITLLAMLLISLFILTVLIVDVVIDSWGILTGRPGGFLSGTMRSLSDDPKQGVHQALVGTFWIAVFVVVLSFPIGICAAIWLEEYALKNRFTRFIELNIRNLAGVPSIVYGLLGLFLFVKGLEGLTGGKSIASAGITLAILVLPIVIITAQEAIRAVPQELKEGAYGVGATKWAMVRSQVLPYAAPGIFTGTLLSMSRGIGEAAPLLLVGAVSGRLGSNSGFFDLSGVTAEHFMAMPVIIVEWVQNSGRDPGFAEAAAAAIVVLLVFVILMNAAAIFLRNHFEKKRG
ncbi:MAG: phosphate ABC transporter permease PstA [Acidimicrobiia bacterium]|nr:phosphate ABC transporter permease PstA [Acidimicrobiia bacterium]MYC57107.1 phosphate ABC transporter permease PstA [Acidimicrobiia bacterium]MYG94791.1 phosphate ABC transporter permease PstA [Acidimicrobiia bacterium]MYI30184.1 phosphate ABC transporter permease PstA [Acidimicrobiia bacterium]